MNKTAIITCTCAHAFQDKLYGPNKRATTPANKVQASSKTFVVRCTVCGREHNLGTIK